MSEPTEPFSDEQYAFLRHVRFGELPPPVRPEDRLAATETDPPRYQPDPTPGQYERDLRSGG
ncbi:hypothetical protein OG271_27200 [Micromonospora rifamycinica]|uniref:hypothetical protein n=1 Tax=Micromonospora rifamycinica TaxID=291594 RepID=UPI002E29B712|nr:hypothetical protein [Micromonospora rifamycinica]